MRKLTKMIYEQWQNSDAGDAFSWGSYDKATNKIYKHLDYQTADEIERSINRKVWRIQEKAFIAGFEYAFKCLSAGKIELKGGDAQCRKRT